MTETAANNREPSIVLFAPAARAAAVADALEGVAAVVVTDGAEDLGAEPAAAIRNAGTPLLKASVEPERAQGFDGLHLTSAAGAIKQARRTLPPNGMLGAGAARTRHAAMQLGEAMPDYVLLGRIATADPTDDDIAAETELVTWWAELFELPCVAVACTPAEACDLAAAGADFIGVNRMVWTADDPAAALRDLAAELAAIPARSADEAGK